jgi:serine phosphatase RsbU (regulator of sigma subunit)
MSDGQPRPVGAGAGLSGSRAFREASLRAEVRRAWVAIAVILLVAAPVVAFGPRHRDEVLIKVVGVAAGLLLLVLQLASMALAGWARRRERDLPLWFAAATVVLECLVPTGVILAHLRLRSLPPYSALSAPVVLAYGLLISLTTLRLRPWLCVLAGSAAALSYGGLVMHVMRKWPGEPNTGLPRAAYANAPFMLFISGLAAAWVCREIRGHFEAALGEAESRRRVEQMERDLGVARSIQRALLPRGQPSIPGFEIAGWNRPADQTGGDYYDWQQLPDGNWIVTLADVSGHGVGPALVTAGCRAYMRAMSQHDGDLASMASRINRLLADDLPDGRFVTMVSVLIDPAGPLALLSAGHGPIVLYVGATGEVRDIMPGDMPLAIDAGQSFGPAQAVTLAEGDVLALVTDGFVEWARPGPEGRREFFGLPRLREALRRHSNLPAREMIEAVAADVAAFAGAARQQDDLTMVVIRRVRGGPA